MTDDDEPELRVETTWEVPLRDMPRGLQLAIEAARRENPPPPRRRRWWQRKRRS